MLVLLLVTLHPGLHASSASVLEKGQVLVEYVELLKELFTGLTYIPDQWEPNMDHIAGLRQIAEKSEELATKAAKAAVFVTSDFYEAELTDREDLLKPLTTFLSRSRYSGVNVDSFDFIRALNGSTFGGIGRGIQSFMRNAQSALSDRYMKLELWIEDIRNEANVSSNRFLTRFCTSPERLETTMCMLQAYGSIFGSNCSATRSSLCSFNSTYYDIDTTYGDRWTAPTHIQECANERIARLSTNESALNRLAMYAKCNVLLAFNFIAFCSALSESHDGFIGDAVQIVRSIADGFVHSQKEIDLSSWPLLARALAAKNFTSAARNLSRDEADEAYNRTAHDIVRELKYTWLSHEYSALVYNSYTAPLQSGIVFYNESEEDSFDESSENIKTFVKRYNSDDAGRAKNELWKSVNVDPKTLADLFDDDGPSTSMADRFRTSELDVKLFRDKGFQAAAVLPCAYRFVWYELAWQYFHAYGTTSEYVFTFRGDNAYKPCGAVVLFP